MPDQLFGPLISFHDAEFGLIGHLKTWLPAYLAARERRAGITPGSLARPKSWVTRQTFNIIPGEERTPAIIVVSNGTVDEPVGHGNGNYDVALRTAVAALTHGSEGTVARRTAGHYQAALIDLLLKHGTWTALGSTKAKIDSWLGFALEDVDESMERTYCSCRLEFITVIRNFANRTGGIAVPPVDPLVPQPDGPTADDIIITPGELP